MNGPREFELVGHDCPLGVYPGPVAAVGRLGGNLVCVFVNEDNTPELQPITEDVSFIPHSPVLTETLAKFDPFTDRLFAFSSENVVAYATLREIAFFESVLSDGEFATYNPFIRLSLAKRIATPDALLKELRRCIEYLQVRSPTFIDHWYAKERIEISRVLSEYKAELSSDWRRYIQPMEKPSFAMAFESAVARQCELLSRSTIHVNTRALGLLGDLYFESRDPDGRRIQTFVECKARDTALDAEDIDDQVKRLADYCRGTNTRCWVVSSSGFTPLALRRAKEWGVVPIAYKDLIAQSRKRCSTFFVEDRAAIFGRRGEVAFFAPSSELVESVKATAAYVETVESEEYVSSYVPVVVSDLSALSGDFPDLLRDALHNVRSEALLRYHTQGLLHGRMAEGCLPPAAVVERNYVISRECLSQAGVKNLERVLTYHLSCGLAVGIYIAGSASSNRLLQLFSDLRRKLMVESVSRGLTVKTPISELRVETQALLDSVGEIMLEEREKNRPDMYIRSAPELDAVIAELNHACA